MGTMSTAQTEEEIVTQCINNFYLAATIQGRLAYFLMSIHAVNPSIMASITNYDPTQLLFDNMVYGMAVHLYSRPSMSIIGFPHRFAFSLLGSMMFNHSSLLVYEWLREWLYEHPYLLTLAGFFVGRIMMIHLLAYLYHADTRCIIVGHMIRRDSTYETMYA